MKSHVFPRQVPSRKGGFGSRKEASPWETTLFRVDHGPLIRVDVALANRLWFRRGTDDDHDRWWSLRDASRGGPETAASRAEGALDPTGGLTDPLLVLNEREANVPVAGHSEADAGRDRHVRLPQEELRELQRPSVPVGFGDLRPDEHRRPRHRDSPPGAG